MSEPWSVMRAARGDFVLNAQGNRADGSVSRATFERAPSWSMIRRSGNRVLPGDKLEAFAGDHAQTKGRDHDPVQSSWIMI
jgi:hypothetical protein